MTINYKKNRELQENGKIVAVVDFYDSDTKEVYCTKRIHFLSSSDIEKNYTSRMQHCSDNVQDMINELGIQNEFTRYEIEKILKGKELLLDDEKLEDLKSKADIISASAVNK